MKRPHSSASRAAHVVPVNNGTLYPGIARIARKLGCQRVALWRALHGIGRRRPELIAAYYEAALPTLTANLSLATLPAGTRLLLPPEGAAELHELLRPHVRAEESALVLLTPLPLMRPQRDVPFSPTHPSATPDTSKSR